MEKRLLTGVLAAGIVLSALPGISLADKDHGNGHGKGHDKGKGSIHAQAHVNTAGSHDKDRWEHGSQPGGYTYNYNRTHINAALLAALSGHSQYSLNTRALKRQQKMPPGIAMNFERGKPLPPGIAKKVYYLPHEGFDYYGIDRRYKAAVYGKDLLVLTAVGVIVDILTNVI